MISVVPAAKATVNVNCPNLTPGGTMKVTISVTAENGESKVYTINTFRAQDPDNPSGILAWLLILASIAFLMLGVLTGIVLR